ncbi:MAG TPA: nicotinate-nucleotide diphosphorylase (carboxylating), partial [Gemmatales bacterium]|nr:nicotinate-nucleotide diphosphorylase (carboxylating) [Gemmatales bacterium]
MPTYQLSEQQKLSALTLIQLALHEDLQEAGDITSKTIIPSNYRGQANLVARSAGVLAGVQLIQMVSQAV